MDRKTYLVTGGAGFIGSHLCQKLLEQGSVVICLDNLYTGSKNNIQPLLANKNFSFIEHDVTERYDIEADYIFNLACPASPPHYQRSPIFTTRTSVLGIINALELATKLNCPLLQASTSEVYGDPKVHPQSEDYWGHVNCTGIRSCYDEGKRVAESLMLDYQRERGTKIRIARIFNTYGPNMDINDGRVVSNFIVQALKNQPITLYGNGEQTRSFCYVDDTVQALIRLINSDYSQPVNIGNPNERSVRDLATKIIALVKSESQLSYEPLPSDDPMQRCPDISRAKQIIDWSPLVDIDTGLTKTINYFSKMLSNTVQPID